MDYCSSVWYVLCGEWMDNAQYSLVLRRSFLCDDGLGKQGLPRLLLKCPALLCMYYIFLEKYASGSCADPLSLYFVFFFRTRWKATDHHECSNVLSPWRESLAGSGHLWFLPLLFSHSLLFVHSSFIFNVFFSFCFPFFSPHLYQYLFWLLLLLFSSLIPRSSLLHRRRTEENFSFPSFSNLFYKLLVVSDPPFLSSSALLPTKLINVTSGRDVDWFITSAASLTAHSIIIDACLHAAYLLELKLFLKSKFPTRTRRPHSRAISRGKHIIARLLTLDSLSCLF